MIERKTFTYDGQNSADFGLYIAGDSVYDAPTRDMDMITIPGRNGQLSIDQGRFENITVTYPCFIWADNQAEFRQKVRAIRNWLCPKHSYYRLEDEYNPESFRLGIYKSGLEVEPIFYNRAGRFELSFDCKPQRFLFTGEEVFTLGEWGETTTYSGEIVSFDGTETTAIKSLKVNIVPKQSGSGDPSPSNVRPISGYDTVNIHVSPTTTAGDGNTYPISLGQTVYGGTLDVMSGKLTIEKFGYVFNGTETIWSGDQGGHTRFTVVNVFAEGPAYTRGQWCSHFTPNTAPIGANNYNNVITGYTPVKHLFIRADAYATADDLKAYILQQYQNGTPVTYVSYLQTPTEIQLTPTEVKTLLGNNNIWADAGTVEVEIGENPNILVNPTPFESSPVFEVEGRGTLTVGNVSMNIVNSGTTIIDSEMMEAYAEENGAIIPKNDSVSGDFPTLASGANTVSRIGITSVKITPRWWTL